MATSELDSLSAAAFFDALISASFVRALWKCVHPSANSGFTVPRPDFSLDGEASLLFRVLVCELLVCSLTSWGDFCQRLSAPDRNLAQPFCQIRSWIKGNDMLFSSVPASFHPATDRDAACRESRGGLVVVARGIIATPRAEASKS
jgi:hypothetical protein